MSVAANTLPCDMLLRYFVRMRRERCGIDRTLLKTAERTLSLL
jgi:hypothetical protein